MDEEEEEEEEEEEVPQLDLTRSRCEDYKALGYKCVDFWQCGEDGKILDSSKDFGAGLLDVRIDTSRPSRRGSFDPYEKTCNGELEVCCKGSCLEDTRRQVEAAKTKPKAKSSSSTFCPGDFTGLRSVAGVCDKFVECYKGGAVVKDCPPGTSFCSNSLMCDWPSKAVCDQMGDKMTVSETWSTSIISSNFSVSDTPGPAHHQAAQLSEIRGRGNDGNNEGLTGKVNFEDLQLLGNCCSDNPPLQSQTVRDEEYSTPSWADVILARSAGPGAEILPAPPSGQLVRLRRGNSPSHGYLQLFLHNRWGYVCDGGEWTMAEADLVCRQLGFSRGVSKTTQGLVHGRVEQSERVTESVECGGEEESLEDCRTLPAGEGSRECQLAEDIVSVSCIPDSWATCDKGEIPFQQSCYSFHPKPTTFHKAVALCDKKGKVLVEIESQVENDMLSELLFQSSLLSNKMDHVWTGGVGSNIARKAGRQ